MKEKLGDTSVVAPSGMEAAKAILQDKCARAQRELDDFDRRCGYPEMLAAVAALLVFIKAYPEPLAHMAETLDFLTTHKGFEIELSSRYKDEARISIGLMRYYPNGGTGTRGEGSTFNEAAMKLIEAVKQDAKDNFKPWVSTG